MMSDDIPKIGCFECHSAISLSICDAVMQHAHVSGLLVQNAGNYRAFRYIRLARGWKLILPYLSILPSSS